MLPLRSFINHGLLEIYIRAPNHELIWNIKLQKCEKFIDAQKNEISRRIPEHKIFVFSEKIM